MGMWALWSAPMIMSTELRNGSLAPDMKAILLNKGALAISDDPLGRQATECVHAGCNHGGVLYGGATSVWNKTLADGSVAVGLLNTGNFGDVGPTFGDFNVSFTPSAVGLHCPPMHQPQPQPQQRSSPGGAAPSGWHGPINVQYSDTECPNVGCHSGQLNPGLCESICDGVKGCNALNYDGANNGCCLRACAQGNLITSNQTGGHGLSYYRAGPAPPPSPPPPPPPPPPPSGPFEVFDVFKGTSLGVRHGEGFWAEVDESSMLLLRIVCK